jgi:hypothetical protein
MVVSAPFSTGWPLAVMRWRRAGDEANRMAWLTQSEKLGIEIDNSHRCTAATSSFSRLTPDTVRARGVSAVVIVFEKPVEKGAQPLIFFRRKKLVVSAPFSTGWPLAVMRWRRAGDEANSMASRTRSKKLGTEIDNSYRRSAATFYFVASTPTLLHNFS